MLHKFNSIFYHFQHFCVRSLQLDMCCLELVAVEISVIPPRPYGLPLPAATQISLIAHFLQNCAGRKVGLGRRRFSRVIAKARTLAIISYEYNYQRIFLSLSTQSSSMNLYAVLFLILCCIILTLHLLFEKYPAAWDFWRI